MYKYISQGIQHHFNKDGLLLPYSCVCFPLPLEINLINLRTFFLHAFTFRLCDYSWSRASKGGYFEYHLATTVLPKQHTSP